jgi:hypothetical protein
MVYPLCDGAFPKRQRRAARYRGADGFATRIDRLEAVAVERRAAIDAAAGDEHGRVADRRADGDAARRNRFKGAAVERDTIASPASV